jgi:HTH-type transcriptional regulator, competence development regulator
MDQLAELRERRALTLRELAEMSGVAADTINQIELGHRKPRPSTLRKLARALEVDVEELMPPKTSAPSTPGQPERTEDKPFTSRSRSFLLPAQEPHERAMTSETQLASDLETIEAAAARALSRVEDEEELRRVAEAIMTSVSKMAEQAAQEKRERV